MVTSLSSSFNENSQFFPIINTFGVISRNNYFSTQEDAFDYIRGAHASIALQNLSFTGQTGDDADQVTIGSKTYSLGISTPRHSGLSPVRRLHPDGTTFFEVVGVLEFWIVFRSLSVDYEDLRAVSTTSPAFNPSTPAFSISYTVGTQDYEHTITVKDVNEAPVMQLLSSQAVDENLAGAAIARFSVVDPDIFNADFRQNPLTISDPKFEVRIENNGEYTLKLKPTESLNYEELQGGVLNLTVTAGGTPLPIAVTVNDINENQPPDANDDSGFTARAGVAKTIWAGSLLANDSDPDANTTLRIVSASSSTGTAVVQNGNVMFTPNASTAGGTAWFEYTISDGTLTDTAKVTLAVGKTILGSNGKDNLPGTSGDDLIFGYNGADTLIGGNGDDIIDGGNGSDQLTGGNGKDIFVLAKNAGNDTIFDFANGFDKFGLTGNLSFSQLTIAASNNNTVIKFGAETLATLIGVPASLIDSTDFV